jgi:hypothetical protein
MIVSDRPERCRPARERCLTPPASHSDPCVCWYHSWQMSWWASYKQGKVDKIVSFARNARSGDYTTTHTCTTTALTDTELASALSS